MMNYEPPTLAMDWVAGTGDLEHLQWLHENRPTSCSKSAMDNACANGHLHVVKWLHEHRTEGCTVRAMDVAIARGDIEMVRWLHFNRTEGCSPDAQHMAVRRADMKMLRWLFDNRSMRCTYQDLMCAANHGHTGVVAWIIERAARPEVDAIIQAPAPLDMVRWAEDAAEQAAMCGFLSVVKWVADRFPGVDFQGVLNHACYHERQEVFEWVALNVKGVSRESAVAWAAAAYRD